MRTARRRLAPVALVAASLGGCGARDASTLVIGVAFETLQTEYWVASFQALEAELGRRGIEMLDAIADGDANRQLDQVHIFIARRVDGIIIAPRDATTVIPIIKAANDAGIPIVLYNRPPARRVGRSVTVVADNRKIAADTMRYMAERARRAGGRRKAMILIGDLGDVNAINRRDGFDDAVRDHPETIEVVARIPTEWSQEKALAGVTNALQAHPDIDFIFTSSDFLFPSLVSALKTAGKYERIGAEGHVLLGGFDGDASAHRMLLDGYLDADGVQDVAYECAAAVQAVIDLRAGRPVEEIIKDPGFVVHQDNLKEREEDMWGARFSR